MKFKKLPENDEVTGFKVTCASADGTILRVETRADGKKGLYLGVDSDNAGHFVDGVFLSRSKALKLAWAIIDELNESVLTR